MQNDNYNKEIEKYERWRKRASNRLPELATRVFALRNKFYTGCGFHWGMERTLGYLILKMNDFDDCPIDQKQLYLKHLILKVKMIGLFKDVINAEKTTRK